MTLRELAAAVRQRFEAAGLPEAALEAEVLVRHVACVDRAAYYAGAEAAPGVALEVDRQVSRRLAREPLAYITGEREFYGLTFGVNSAVLIPRPESELLVELALGELQAGPDAWLADIGTGSGCLAIAIESMRARAGRTVATDASLSALMVARANAARHGVSIHPVLGDLAAPLRNVDIVVANLPYIASGEVDALEPELRNWEPRLALDGGDDGLALVRTLVRDCAERPHPRVTFLEVGVGEADAVAAFGESLGHTARLHRDLGGIDRVVELR
ncbi:MAG: peptide chain release factor N(5)-glutamine methyltransferase [Dehalococcoidia bacterium]|nr:peptide chain release factor N(5)-glutamine methyltransferase [Dehalococcoidia bacterium]